jgi:hypothetical protein
MQRLTKTLLLLSFVILVAAPLVGLATEPPTRSVREGRETKATPEQNFPKGWGGGGKQYEIQLDRQVKRGGAASAMIRFVGSDSTEFGTLTQCIAPDNYIGKRVRLSGYIKTNNASKASLWMRVDGKDPKAGSLAFDNMDKRSLRGTQDWTKCEVVLDIAEDATGICLGFLIAGKGQAWADDLQVEVVDKSVPVTDMIKARQRTPTNLNFEE